MVSEFSNRCRGAGAARFRIREKLRYHHPHILLSFVARAAAPAVQGTQHAFLLSVPLGSSARLAQFSRVTFLVLLSSSSPCCGAPPFVVVVVYGACPEAAGDCGCTPDPFCASVAALKSGRPIAPPPYQNPAWRRTDLLHLLLLHSASLPRVCVCVCARASQHADSNHEVTRHKGVRLSG